MKVTVKHRAELRRRFAAVDTPERREVYRTGQFPRADRVKDLDKRYRWDLLWAVNGDDVIGDGIYTDAHIDTALRTLVAAL